VISLPQPDYFSARSTQYAVLIRYFSGRGFSFGAKCCRRSFIHIKIISSVIDISGIGIAIVRPITGRRKESRKAASFARFV
jgi:hypothetical protein